MIITRVQFQYCQISPAGVTRPRAKIEVRSSGGQIGRLGMESPEAEAFFCKCAHETYFESKWKEKKLQIEHLSRIQHAEVKIVQ